MPIEKKNWPCQAAAYACRSAEKSVPWYIYYMKSQYVEKQCTLGTGSSRSPISPTMYWSPICPISPTMCWSPICPICPTM